MSRKHCFLQWTIAKKIDGAKLVGGRWIYIYIILNRIPEPPPLGRVTIFPVSWCENKEFGKKRLCADCDGFLRPLRRSRSILLTTDSEKATLSAPPCLEITAFLRSEPSRKFLPYHAVSRPDVATSQENVCWSWQKTAVPKHQTQAHFRRKSAWLKGFWLAPLLSPAPSWARWGGSKNAFHFAGRRARQSFRAMQFRGPTWLPVRKMCVGHENKPVLRTLQTRAHFRRKSAWLKRILARAFAVPCAFLGALGWFQDAFHSLAGAPDNPFRAMQFCGPTWLPVRTQCVLVMTNKHVGYQFLCGGHQNSFRRENTSEANLHG